MVVEDIIAEEGIEMAYQTWMYAIPFGLGNMVYKYDSYKDFRQMQRDFNKNTGRTVKYSTQSYDSRAFRTAGSLIDDVIHTGGRVATMGRGVGKTTSDVTKVI